MKKEKIAIIAGAGPAGLTAAFELLKQTKIKPIVFEMSSDIGGISKTVDYKGNKIDIGGHRFFSKSDKVMNWWTNILPIQSMGKNDETVDISYHNKRKSVQLQNGIDPDKKNDVMLIRNRLSRIYYLREFFDYPISLSLKTLNNLGIVTTIQIGVSYFKTKIFPIKNEQSLEDFLVNRFGKRLYEIFFKNYTEKVWGLEPREISAEWGRQRIKGVSVSKILTNAVKNLFSSNNDLKQKNVETSLISKFLYPKFGPGQLWEKVANQIKSNGGGVITNSKIIGITHSENKVTKAKILDLENGNTYEMNCDYCFSSMPVKELISNMEPKPPEKTLQVAKGLKYRDFITVGLLLNKLKVSPDKGSEILREHKDLIPDNWLYIQEPEVKVGRVQIFNNWSPYMVKDKDKVWIGLEYFCNKDDSFWSLEDNQIKDLAISELESIGLVYSEDVEDSTVIRMEKTYPVYFGTYYQFSEIRNFTDKISNLYLIGRNGMHKYNNQDHSMLTAMTAVENIVNKSTDKKNIWDVNTEEDYHEVK